MSSEIRPEDVRRIAAQKEREVYGEERRYVEPHFGSARPRAADNPYMRSQAARGYERDAAQPNFLADPRYERQAPPDDFVEEVDDGLSLPPNYAGTGYAGGGAEADEPARPARRLPMLLALVALVAFGGLLYVGYEQIKGPEGGTAGGEPPVIQAQAGEEKVKPAHEGGIEVPNQEATVLNPSAGERTEVLMPPPEEPVAPPAPVAPALPAAGTATAPTAPAPTAPAAAQPAEPDDGDKLAALLLATTGGSAAGATTAQAGGTAGETASTAVTQPATTQPTTVQPGAPQPLVPQPSGTQVAETQAAAPQTAALPAAPVVGAGDFLIQLASLTSSDAAQQTWSRLQQKHPDLLGDMALRVQEADIEGKGKYYRVQAGPLPNRATADDMCALLKAEQQDCIVVKR